MQRHALTHTHTIQNSCARRGLLERAPVSQKSQKCGSLKQVFFFFSVFIEQFEKWMVIRMWKKKQHNMSRPCRARAIREREIKERSKGLRHAPFFISSLVLGTSNVLVIGLLRAQTVLWDSSCSQSLGACCSSSEPSMSLSIAWAESWILP